MVRFSWIIVHFSGFESIKNACRYFEVSFHVFIFFVWKFASNFCVYRYRKDNKILILLANISYAAPVILTSLWIKPISRDYLTVRIFSGMTKPMYEFIDIYQSIVNYEILFFFHRMSADTFDSLRLIVVISIILLKLGLMPIYFQSYLDLAVQRLEMQRKEAGRISNKEFQKKVIQRRFWSIFQ